MFPERIDLGLVAPTMNSNTNIDPQYDSRSANEIFKELVDYYHFSSKNAKIDNGSLTRLWHLTSSLKSYCASNHGMLVNVSKSLLHSNSNFSPEVDELHRIEERYTDRTDCLPKYTIAVGCYVSDSKEKLSECRKLYKSILHKDVYQATIIEPPETFLNRIEDLSAKYRTRDIVALNLANTYREKLKCLEIVSQIFHLKNAH